MVALQANDIIVEFPVDISSQLSLKQSLINAASGGRLFRGGGGQTCVRGLDGISFDIQPGERVGIYGPNGSGKTTLLRVIAGAYQPTAGLLRREGSVIALLDISLGFDQDATGYENIVLRGLVMGLSLAEIRQRVSAIAEFAELGAYLYLPVKTYSSGMQLRLAFAIATSVQSDIILMDEWLAVGDAAFQVKVAQRLDDLIQCSAILVLASHDFELLRKTCTRIIRMQKGRISLDLPAQSDA